MSTTEDFDLLTDMVSNEQKKKADVDMNVIKNMIAEASAEEYQFNKIMICLRLFHFLEYNHSGFTYYEKLRENIRRKAKDFIATADSLTSALDHYEEDTMEYNNALYLSIAATELRMSCKKVLKLINKVEQ